MEPDRIAALFIIGIFVGIHCAKLLSVITENRKRKQPSKLARFMAANQEIE
jgi:hypothetical protein